MEAAAPAERDKLIVRLFADCGLRLSELMGLETSSVIRSGRQAMLAVMGKGSRERRVPMPPGLVRRLDRYIAGLPKDRHSERIFLSLRRGPLGDYEPLTDSGVKQVVRDASARAGIGRTVHPHLLRHFLDNRDASPGGRPQPASCGCRRLPGGDRPPLRPCQ
jgi:site-specific recombinase XerD